MNPMTRTTPLEGQPLLQLVSTWVLMVPLFYYASMGTLWFQSAAVNNALSFTYGSLVSSGGADDGPLVTVLILAVLGMLLLPMLHGLLRAALRDGLFVALMLLAAASSAWSQFPLKSFEWSVVAAVCLLFAFYLHHRFSPERQIKVLLMLGSICLILSFVLALFFPLYGTDHTQDIVSWRGIYSVKNTCADMTAFLLLPALFLEPETDLSRLLRAVYVVLSAVLIWMTRSSTGLILLATMVVTVFALRQIRRFRSTERGLLLLFAGLAVGALTTTSILYTGELASLLGKDATLTGRTDIWGAAMISIMKHPVLGYGYMAFWRGYVGESSNISLATHWAVTHAHNGFLEVWLSLGLGGLILIGLTLLRALRDAVSCLVTDGPAHLEWYVSIVVLTVIYNLDESAMVSTNHLAWVLYILACLGLSSAAQGIRKGRAHA